MFNVVRACLIFWTLVLVTIAAVSAKDVDACTLNSPPAGREICGIRGIDRHAYSTEPFVLGEPAIVKTLEDCALICSRRARRVANYPHSQTCAGIEFDPEDGRCQLLNQRPTDHFVKQTPNHGYFFYTIGCFTCPDLCPQSFGASVVDDADFEGQLLGPWISNGGRLVHNKGRNFSKAWKCAGHDYFYEPCSLSQTFNICPKSQYAVRLYYKEPEKTSHPLTIFVSDTASIPSWSFHDSLEPGNHSNTNNWKEATVFVPLSDSGPVDDEGLIVYFIGGPIEYENEGKGYLIDDVSVFRLDPNMDLKHGAKSVIVNGGFETGKFGPWAVYTFENETNISIVSPGIGSNKYRVQIERGDYEYYDYRGRLQQKLTTTPHTNYLFSMDYRASIPTHIRNGGALYVDLSSGGKIVSYHRSVGNESSTLSFPFVAYAATTVLNITTQYQRFFLDNFSLTELANPIFKTT